MKISSPKMHTTHLTVNEEALLRCQTALELKDKGDADRAQEIMRPLWGHLGERPQTKGLHPSVAAEVLHCTGVLTCWIGSRSKDEKAQEIAKNLITESITFYESIGDIKKVAAGRAEIAYCYWCEGALEEARVMFKEALVKLTAEGTSRARALLGLAVVEWSASRYSEALRILDDNAFLFEKITNNAIKGAYHSQVAMVMRMLVAPENRVEYLRRSVKEYQEADRYFKLARNVVFRADVKNNVGNLLRQLNQFREATRYLDEARRLAVSVRDRVRTAQIDDTRAQVLIAEKKFKQAEVVAKGAVRALEKSGHQCLLADALITHGIALARLKQTERAQFVFQKAIEVAHQVGALNKAGLAALTLLEELDELSTEASVAAYDRASDWLSKSQSQDLLLRLNAASRKVVTKLRGEMKAEDATEAILNKPYDLHGEVLKYEASLIRQALAQANGSVTRAASLLEMSYQGLAYVIGSRHKDLLKERSPVRRRSRKRS
jgi:tetratricopeptide (TPR) repeat protein